MAETYPVSTTPDRPEFAIKIDGAEIDPVARLDVLEIDVSEEIGRHGRASLLLTNWDGDAQQPTHSEGEVFAPGASVEILLGYADELETVFDGVITALHARFLGDPAPTLEVGCRTRSILLDGPERSWVREDISDGDLAAELASERDLTAETAQGVTQPVAVSRRQTDWRYLVDRAARLGYVAYVRGSQLVFREPAAQEGQIPELAWGRTLLELDVRQDLARRHDPAEATAWDIAELAVISSEAAAADSRLTGGERPTPTAALSDAGWSAHRRHSTAAPLDPLETEHMAKASADRQVLRHLSGSGRTIGLPSLRADGWVAIAEVGARLAGPHYLTAVRHRLGRLGFTTEFQLGLPSPLAPPAAGPGAEGLLLGVVDDLDDPDSLARVKVRFPWLTDAPDPVWARLATLDAGPGQGSFFVPDVGQEVVVAGVDGDRRHPIVLGALWNGQQAPPVEIDPQANEIRGFTSRSGHKLVFDDAEPGSVTVETPGGRRAVLSDADEHVELTDASGSTITISGDGIALSAASGDISLDAPSGKVKISASGIEAASTGPSKVESTATLDLKASGSLSVNGALVRIN